jgi:hypothetical protein
VVHLPRAVPAPRAPTSASETNQAPAIEALTATAPPMSITAQLFGAPPLHERAPHEYWPLFERYTRLLEAALDHHTYRGIEHNISAELQAIAEQLGRLGAGAREVADLHARALRQKTRDASAGKAQALTSEGRIVSFELMGHLLSFYRRRAGISSEASNRG